MKRYYLFLSLLFVAFLTMAQTQHGIVKTRGRMENGVLKPGQGLQGATVQVKDLSAVVSGTNGNFSFPLKANTFLVQSVKKNGYQLVDMEACRSYQYSKAPIYLVMETPEQQHSDHLAAERKFHRNLERQLQQKEDEIVALNLSLEEKNRQLQEIVNQREENEKIVETLSHYYSKLDYDRLDVFQRRVSDCLENGELEKADSLLRSRGDMHSRIENVRVELDAEAKEEEELALRQHRLDKSKAGTVMKMEQIAEDCYSFYLRFLQIHQNDSAAHYLELRAAMDTTNVDWANDAGLFIKDYLADYDKACSWYELALRQAQLQYGEESESTGTVLESIGLVYACQDNYDKALEHLAKALDIREKLLGNGHIDVARSYNSIGYVYDIQGKFDKALDCYDKSLQIALAAFDDNHAFIAMLYNNIGMVYCEREDFDNAIDYYSKALELKKNVLGNEHPGTAISYSNLAQALVGKDDYAKAIEYYEHALHIFENYYSPKHPYVGSCYCNIGQLYDKQGNYDKAIEYFIKDVEIEVQTLGFDCSNLAPTYNNIGFAYYHKGDYAKAVEYYDKSLNILMKVFNEDYLYVAVCRKNIGNAYLGLHENSKALDYYQKALTIFTKELGPDHRYTKETEENIKKATNP